MEHYTCWRTTISCIWSRLPFLELTDGRFADNYEAIQLATNGDHPPNSKQIVKHSVFVGFSSNVGNDVNNEYQYFDRNLSPPRSIAKKVAQNRRSGIKWYDGPGEFIFSFIFGNI